MKHTRIVLFALTLAATLHAAVKQCTVSCDGLSLSNDVPVICIKGRPMNVKTASPEILASLKRLAAKSQVESKAQRARSAPPVSQEHAFCLKARAGSVLRVLRRSAKGTLRAASIPGTRVCSKARAGSVLRLFRKLPRRHRH